MAVHRIVVAVMCLLFAFSMAAASDEQPSETAMEFAGQFSDEQLSGMLSRIGGGSGAMIEMSQLGGSMVADVFDLQIDAAVEKYGPQWQTNMAQAWSPLLTDEEMASLMAEGAASPYSEKYSGLRAQAGQAMQASSEDLFKEILTEVIAETQLSLQEISK